MEKTIGRCLCGQVRFEISEVKTSAHCHCAYCRFSAGSAFVTWVVVPSAGFRFIQGEDVVRWYQSSTVSRRGFCSHCGSTLFFESTLCPGEIHVTRAVIESSVTLKPQYNCFSDQKVDWADPGSAPIDLPTSSPELSHYQKVQPLKLG